MDTVILGDTHSFTKSFYDSDGALTDPTSVQFQIIRNASQSVTNIFSYSSGDITRLSLGRYQYDYEVPTYATPGIYTGKWTAVIDGETTYEYDEIQISEEDPEASTLLDAPRRYGVIKENFRYTDLGFGETDRIFLVGHADGMGINDPYQVVNMQEAINRMGADTESPLVRALLEIYNLGARDIWLVAAAPMREYVSDLAARTTPRAEWDDKNFYEKYYDRLEATYEELRQWDLVELLVPLEAPFYDAHDVDFLTQLADHCLDAMSNTGNPRIGFIGTRIDNWTTDDIEAMANDVRLNDYTDSGKFVVICAGEGVNLLPQMPFSYTGSVATCVAGILASKEVNKGFTYSRLPYTASLVGRDLTKAEISSLCNAKVNPAIRTPKAKRGTPFQIVMATDNTLTPDGSDFWSVSNIRIVNVTIQHIRALGRAAIGTVNYPQFNREVKDFMNSMVRNNYIRDYKLNMIKDPLEKGRVLVEVSLSPYMGVREISFGVEVGPGV